MLRGSHAEPDGIGVGVGVVEAVVLEQDAMDVGGDAGDGDGGGRRRSGSVDIEVVPDEDGGFVVSESGKRVDVRRLADAAGKDCIERNLAGAGVPTRLPFIKANMRKTFRTGLSTPLVARERKPSK